MLILVVLLLIPVVIFAVQNAQLVSITFLSWSLSLNMAIVVLGSLLIGLIVGTVCSWFKGAKTRGQVKQLTKSLEASTRQVTELERALKEQKEKTDILAAEADRLAAELEALRAVGMERDIP
jgi:putative membrane protein